MKILLGIIIGILIYHYACRKTMLIYGINPEAVEKILKEIREFKWLKLFGKR